MLWHTYPHPSFHCTDISQKWNQVICHKRITCFPNFLCLITLLVRVWGIIPFTIRILMMKGGKVYIQLVYVYTSTHVQLCKRCRIIYIITILYIIQKLNFSMWYTSPVPTHSTLFNKELTVVPKYVEVTSHEVPPRNDAGTVLLH